jgi:putative transposase
VSPSRRRETVRHVQQSLEVPQRRTCRVLGQARRTQRYVPKRRDDEGKLIERMLELVRRHPRFGYRRIWGMLRNEGWRVNLKRVWRLWKQEDLKVPQKQQKKRRLGTSENGCIRRRAEGKDQVGVGFHLRPHGQRAEPEVAERDR